ncbi:MAG: methionine--tRNA ligase [Candidatus Kerfeldbacteria bacterium CG_4_10_14_0_8_um_filter_42_10]|uniref:methionine--tRNA ligase n=1 Tax=Candidatus Kerfeldbacteria bacterium CG_4_10_14_0_8_um_filter_42_10 TaxID=2014248 RepID=A0A2M7RJN6_9BACT|nr:MAG: methionine--tRNA ligase [Candidatus Kerfeldbacteria bacterium CG_4_10_14_0_8_um_filter_42_10]
MSTKSKYYITTPIYYVNDKPHIGHAYTTIAADVLARWHRLKGDEVFFLTGTDEHGAKVEESAKKAGKSPLELCDENSEKFKKTFESLNLSFDYFIRTTDQRHKEAVAKFMQKLWENGDIYEGTYEGLYCTGCENFLTEKELVNGKCPIHLTVPEKITEKNYFFKLKKYLPQVKELIEKDEIKIRPEDKKKETLGLFQQGLEDFSVSRERVKWGIPLPFDQSQVTYVWVEALQNYVSAIGYGDNEKEFKKWWIEADVLHLMAKDILKFHCIYWPALLLAAGEKPPKELFLHGFFTINGQKMSKSLGNVIDPNEMVKKYGADATRYLLLSQFPFGQDGDIKAEKFDEQYNAYLANGIGNLVSRVANLIEQGGGQLNKKLKTSDLIFKEVSRHLEKLEFTEAIAVFESEINNLDYKLQKEKPWEKAVNDENRLKFLQETAGTILAIANAIEPFMPETGAAIQKKFLASKITKGQPLFPRMQK